ncbi:MAG: hypothetical protein JXR07_12665 [Reichenbachiella sp.]
MKMLLIYLSSFFYFHAGHIAEYTYSLNGNQLSLKFEIEKEQLLHFKFNNNCNFETLTALCTSKYLNQYSAITINGNKLALELISAKTSGENFILYMSTSLNEEQIENVSITNHCFTQFDSAFKNRIIVDIGPFQSSYLLTKANSSFELK